MVGNPVHFTYINTGSSLPASYPDADTIYFLEEAKEIRVGDKVLGNVDDLAIHSEQLLEVLQAWSVKSVEFTGSGDNVSDITFNSETGKLTVTKSNLPSLSKGAAPEPQVVELEPDSTFDVVTDTSVSGHTITDTVTRYKLPNSQVYQAGDGIVIDGNQISLPTSFYDYLVEKTFPVPAISVFTVTGLGSSAEIGTSVTVTGFTHKETNITSIDGKLTVKRGSTVLSNDVDPVSSDTAVQLTSQTVTRTTAGSEVFTLSGVNKLGASFSKTASKEFYVPKFLGADPDATVTAEEILLMTRGRTIPTTLQVVETSYVYFVTDGTINIIKDTDTGFGVPIEASVTTSVTINDVPVNYHVYRTSNRIMPGTYHFSIT